MNGRNGISTIDRQKYLQKSNLMGKYTLNKMLKMLVKNTFSKMLKKLLKNTFSKMVKKASSKASKNNENTQSVIKYHQVFSK